MKTNVISNLLGGVLLLSSVHGVAQETTVTDPCRSFPEPHAWIPRCIPI